MEIFSYIWSIFQSVADIQVPFSMSKENNFSHGFLSFQWTQSKPLNENCKAEQIMRAKYFQVKTKLSFRNGMEYLFFQIMQLFCKLINDKLKKPKSWPLWTQCWKQRRDVLEVSEK